MKILLLILGLSLTACGTFDGDEGPRGDRGDVGETGETVLWHNGSGGPNNSIGSDGHFYVDDDSGDYYKKVAGVWIRQ